MQALSNLGWAMATQAHLDPMFFNALLHEASLRLERMSPQNLATLLWACAVARVGEPR